MSEPKTVSGEEYRKMSSRHQPSKQIELSTNTIRTVIIVAILCVISFGIGVAYQKHQQKSASAPSTGLNGGFGGGGGRFRNGGSFGQVTAISSTSISVQNPRTETTKTFSIDSSTKITDNGHTVTTSDIQVGSVAIIGVASSGSTVASTITVNPNVGGGPAAPTSTQ